MSYLESCLDHSGGATAPVLHPCETFELLWAAYHLFLGGASSQRLLRPLERKRLLADLGEPVDPRVLQAFEATDGSFVRFPYERHSSVGVNAHVLHALARVPGYPQAHLAVERILTYLADQHSGMYWIDKWHISPLYATAHVLYALEDLPPEQFRRVGHLVDRSRYWLRQSQNADGSWGFYGQPNAEETAYGLLALLTFGSARSTCMTTRARTGTHTACSSCSGPVRPCRSWTATCS